MSDTKKRPGLEELKERLRNTPIPDDDMDRIVADWCNWYDRLVASGIIRAQPACHRCNSYCPPHRYITVGNMHRYINVAGLISYDMCGQPIMAGVSVV